MKPKQANQVQNLKHPRKVLGEQGETLAADYLNQQGYPIICRNWRCRTGELDIVANKDDVLIFVEVRSRRLTGTFGSAQESVDYRKQKQVRETAQMYVYQHKKWDCLLRFDVISVYFTLDGTFSHMDHLPNAF